MKDFDIAKYLRENYEGPFKTFQPLVNLPALKEESEEQLDTTVPYEGPDPHLDGMGSEYDQVAPVEEGDTDELTEYEIIYVIQDGKCYRVNDEGYRKEVNMSYCRLYAEGEEHSIQEAGIVSKVFDLSDPESSEDALEWIYDNTNFEVETEDEDGELRQAQIEDIIGYVNQKLSGHEIDYNMTDDDTIELTIKPTGATMEEVESMDYDDSVNPFPSIMKDKEDAYGAGTEQGQFDRMMGMIDRTLETQLPKIKKAVDKARQMGLKDMAIFKMLQTNSLTGPSVQDLVNDGFDPQEIVDFFATDFSMEEDTDNVTAADNAAYGADQEAGEPI